MRRKARIDSNQRAIVEALTTIGAQVQTLAQLGAGVPDLLVAFRWKWFVLEIKDGTRKPSEQKLTPAEKEWHQKFGLHAPVYVVGSVNEAIKIVTHSSSS